MESKYAEEAMSEEKRLKINKTAAKYCQKRRMLMTEDEFEKKKALTKQRNAEYRQRLLMNETEEERTKRLEYYRLMGRRKFKEMTSEQRAERRIRLQKNHRRRVVEETEEQKKERLQRENQSKRKRIERLTPEEYAAYKKRRHEHYKQKMMNETPEQRQRRLEASKINNRRWKAKRAPEERREIYRAYNDRYKQLEETAEEREIRLDRERGRKRKWCDRRKIMTKVEMRPSTEDLRRNECKKLGGEAIKISLTRCSTSLQNAAMDKLDMRAVVILKRISLADHSGRSQVSTEDTEDGNSKRVEASRMEVEKWGLRPLVVRLERIDVDKTVQQLKSQTRETQVQKRPTVAARITHWFHVASKTFLQ